MALLKATLPTIKYEGRDWSGLTTSNNLGYLFGEQPIRVSNFVDTLYKVSLGEDLIARMNEYPVLSLDDDREYEWMLMGADGKNIPLISVTDSAGNAFTNASTPGKYGERFYMFFGEKLFFKTHVIVGNKPDLYHLLVVEEPVQSGASFKYTVELVTDNAETYIPYAELLAGTRWSVDYSLSTQILSNTGSDISFTSPFLMTNRISMIRKKHTVPGDMINKGKNEPVQFLWQYANKSGQTATFKTWLNRLDWEFDRQFRLEKARLLMFGKSNRRADGSYGNIGDSGYEIKAGLGLREQISPSNILYYTQFNIETLVDFALSLSVGKLPEDARRFVIGTGEHGLKMVSRAIEQYAGAAAIKGSAGNGLQWNRMNTISGVNKASFTRPQFNMLADINGLRFEFMHIPEYDDPIRNKLYHPDGGLIESYRLTIMDFGTQAGHPNIQLVRVKGNDEVFGYEPGLRDPYSPGGKARSPKIMASAVDGYVIHRADWCGVKVHNPLRMGEWLPDYYQV
jgi:hypothetical protein